MIDDVVEREIETVDAATRAFLEMAAFYNAACAASDAGDEDEAERCAALGEDAERRAMAYAPSSFLCRQASTPLSTRPAHGHFF